MMLLHISHRVILHAKQFFKILNEGAKKVEYARQILESMLMLFSKNYQDSWTLDLPKLTRF